MTEVPVHLHFPVGTIGNSNLVKMTVYLRRVPVEGESIDFGEPESDSRNRIDPDLDGDSFIVKTVAWQIDFTAPGVNPPPIVVLGKS